MIVYRLTNRINGKSYIGQSVRSLQDRKRDHVSDMQRLDTYFSRALKKYGEQGFDWVVIAECDSKEELDSVEIEMIKKYDTFENGYNLTKGGKGMNGRKHTEESKQKVSKARKGKKRKPFSEEWKRKMSASYKRLKHTEETKQKMAEAHKGLKPTEETKQKIAENRVYMSGKDSPYTKSIVLIHPNGLEEKFDYMKEACDKYNLDSSNLSAAARGRQKYTKGYKCRYV